MNKYIFLLAVTFLLGPSMAHAQFVTNPAVVGADLRFGRLGGLAIDSTGTFVVSDLDGGKIVRLSPSLKPIKTTLFSTDGSYDLRNPGVPLVRSNGELLVPDFGSDKVLRFDSLGNYVASIDGTVGKMFADPSQVAEDSTGAIYIADSNNHRIVKFSPDGTFEWEVGSLGTAAGQFKHVGGIAVTPSQQVIVSDVLNNRICVYSTNGDFVSSIDTSVVNVDVRHPGSIVADVDGTFWVISNATGNIVRLDLTGQVISGIDYRSIVSTGAPSPRSLAILGNELFIADGDDSQIYRFDKDGRYLGKLLQGNDDGSRLDIPSAAAKINTEYVVADSGNHRLAFYALGGEFIRSVGSFGDGVGYFQFPTGLSVSSDGLIAVADSGNHRVQVVRPDASVSLVIPPVGSNYSLSFPSQAVWVQDGTLWIVDQNNSCIRHVDSAGNLLATIGGRGSSDRTFESPTALAIAPNGDIFVSDTYNHRIQRFSSDGTYLATIGTFGAAPSQFNEPKGIVFLNQDLLAVADSGNHRIQVFHLDGTFKAEHGSFGDGTGQYMTPEQLTVVHANRIIVSDSSTNKITLLQIDLSTPSSTILFVPDTGLSWSNSNVTATITSTDNDGGFGVKEIHYSVNMGTEQVITGSSATFTLSENGTHSIAYYAIDNAGNTETTQYATVRIDKTRPTVNAYVIGSLVTVVAQDTVSGVASTKVSIDGAAAVNYTGSFTVAPGAHTVTYWATDQAGNESTREVVLVGVSVASVAVSPTTLFSTKAGVGTVKLSLAAPVGGVVVMLESNSPAVSVPVSVTVPAGALSVTFPVTAGTVATDTKTVVTASVGGQEVHGTVYVLVPFPKILTVSPTTIIGGDAGIGTVALASNAGVGGQVVNLTSSNVNVVVPATVTVPAGATSATFPVKTSIISSDIAVAISADADGSGITTTVLIKRVAPKSITFAPSSVVGGNSSVATLTVTKPAPAGGIVIDLRSVSSNVSVPSTVTIAAGATTATFPVTTVPVKKSESAMIQAYAAGVKVSAVITVTATSVVSISMNPTTVVGGLNSTATVTLNGVAPVGGTTIQLFSTNVAASVPASVVVPGGSKTVTFPVTTVAVAVNTSASIAAKYLGTTKSAALTIAAPTVSTLTLAPSSLTGGATSKLTIKLSGKAATGGVVVTLTSSNTVIAQLPTSVTIPAGSDTVDVTIQTGAVAVTTNVTITAKTGAVAKTAVLTVNK